MQSSLRIARVEVGQYRLLVSDFAELEGLHRELTATIRRHLPRVTASLLALPVPAADGITVDWYSDLGGQPVPLAALPAERRALVREKLQDRLNSLQRLADELPRIVRGSDDLAKALRAATHYPGDEHVFAVGDEPVLTLWGFVSTGRRQRLATPTQARATGSRRRWLLWLGLTTLTLAGLGGAGWHGWMYAREQALRADAADALASGCTDSDGLALLGHRLQQIDPDGRRLGELQRQISAEQQRCSQVATVGQGIASAGWDCAAIGRLPGQLAGLDPAREPVPDLLGRIEQRTAVCEQASRLNAELEREHGNCGAVAALADQLGEQRADDATVVTEGADGSPLPDPLAHVRERIQDELALCANATALAEEVAAASAQCEPLLRLDGRLAGLDTSRAPLLPVRQRLDEELARCARAEAFSRDLIDAQMDCTRIKALDARMQGEDVRKPPLLPVRERLDEALERCKALDALDQAMRDAGHDCARLADLAETIRDTHANNPIFVDLRRRIASETGRCDLAERLRAELAAASGDCTALGALAPRINATDAADERLAGLRKTLAAERELCTAADDWRQRIASAGEDCQRIGSLRATLPGAAAASPQFKDILARLAAGEQRCLRIAQDQAKAETERARRVVRVARAPPDEPPAPASDDKGSTQGQRSSASAARRCPGQRTTGETPQLVMVFDASGSMRHGINADAGALRALRQIGDSAGGAVGGLLGGLLSSAVSGPSRMKVAKEAGARIVGQLPSDVDVGLVKIEDCPAATNAGFYPPARRQALLGQIRALQPREETPLASAIAQAASMLDGVNRPAVIAVISDGEDTCGGDVCATAARIARSKPKLKINVVDIAGLGGANCAARATGGRVLRAGNAAELGTQMQRATEEVMGPAECRGG